jgi:glycosyltransferase involved in cell wall biosynthesis
MFVHTQVPAILLAGAMHRTPTVVSIDATPLQYDSLGEFYRHAPGPAPVERLKHRLHRRAFHGARRIISWSAWGRDGLAADYDIDPDLVSVIAPGVDVERWQPSPRAADDGRPLEVLFVGGDLPRKGGDLLLDACARLRDDNEVPDFELHVVTGTPIEPRPGVVVHHGVTPNSPELVARFRAADLFCLPTLGDCLPLVLAEAGAAGLPLISTSVGGIGEIVRPGVTGELVAPGDLEGLVAALRVQLCDPARRTDCGTNARALIERHHDARVNAGRVLDVISAALSDA